MIASFRYTEDGRYFLPAIIHEPRKIEVLEGPPHVSIKSAIRYAQIEINERNGRKTEEESVS